MPRHDCKLVPANPSEDGRLIIAVCDRGCGCVEELTLNEWQEISRQQKERDEPSSGYTVTTEGNDYGR